MDEHFAHEKGRQILREVAFVFQSKPIFRRKDLQVLFVCGAASGSNGNTMRAQFIRWAGSNLPHCILLLAEEAYRNTFFHDPPETLNLAVFEAIIAEVSDCVLIFPESEGSFAEMGFFSGSSTVSRKTLVANDLHYQAKDSFANLGPIAAINSKSFLRPAIYLQRADGILDFAPLKERLERLLCRSHRIRIPYSTYKNLSYGQKLVITLQLLQLLQPVTLSGLYAAIKTAFDGCSTKELKQILSILGATRYVVRRDDYFTAAPDLPALAEIEGFNPEDLRARILQYYRVHQFQLFQQVVSEQP